MAAYWEIAAHLAYDIYSKYKRLIVNSVFSQLGFWSGNFFLIASFPDHCLLVHFPFKWKLYTYEGCSINSRKHLVMSLFRKLAEFNCVSPLDSWHEGIEPINATHQIQQHQQLLVFIYCIYEARLTNQKAQM